MRVVSVSGSTRRWIVVHLITSERVFLPKRGKHVWELAFHEGSALLTCGSHQMWLRDMIEHQLAKAPSGDLFLVGEDEAVTPLLPKLQAHTKHDLTIQIGWRSASINVYRFEHAFVGARVWWSLTCLWLSLALDSSMSESQWRETWWPWWCKSLNGLGFPAPPHLRRGIPQRPCTATADLFLGIAPTRHLDEASCASHALLAIACKAAAPPKRSTNASPSNKKNGAAWQELLEAIAMNFIDNQQACDITLYLDETVVSDVALPLFGADPIRLPMSNGVLELAPLAKSTPLGRKLNERLGAPSRQCVIEIMLKLTMAGKAAAWAFQQFLYIFRGMVECALLQSMQGGDAVETALLGVFTAPPPPRRNCANSGGQSCL